jgi:hypothetical protein
VLGTFVGWIRLMSAGSEVGAKRNNR